MVIFDSTPLPTQSNTSNTSYQPIAPHPTQSTPHGGEQEHGTQNIFRVEPPKRKKTNRKKDHREEAPQLMEIGSMVLGPMGPSFALLPSLQLNSCPRSGTRGRQNSAVDSTMSQFWDSPRPKTVHGAKIQEDQNNTIDLTGPEPQPRGSFRSMPPCPPTSEGSLNVRSMILGPMGPSIAVLPSAQSNSRSQGNGAQAWEQRVRTFDLTGSEPQFRGANYGPVPLRPQEHSSGSREQRVRTVVYTELEAEPRDSSWPLSQPRVEHDIETQERLTTANPTEPELRSRNMSSQPPQIEHISEAQSRDASSPTPAPRLLTNEGDLEKYVSRCWDAGCTSCRSYSVLP